LALTPEEIENRTFPVDLRGYDKETVHAFLEEVAKDYKELLSSRDPESQSGTDAPDALDAFTDQLAGVLRAAAAEAEQVVARARLEAADLVEEELAGLEQLRAEADRERALSLELRESAENDLTVAENLRQVAEEEAATILADAESKAQRAASMAREELAVALGEAMGAVRRASSLLDDLGKTLVSHDLLPATDELDLLSEGRGTEADSS
jgi:DivIVA domain-containing protein